MRDPERDPQQEVRAEERVLGAGDADRAPTPVRVPRRELTPAQEGHAIPLLHRVEGVVIHPLRELVGVRVDALMHPRRDRDPHDEADEGDVREPVDPADRVLEDRRLARRGGEVVLRREPLQPAEAPPHHVDLGLSGGVVAARG